MSLTIYGSPRSRTMRVLWTAAELGLAYEHVPLEWDDPALKSEAFLKLNPAGSIPVITDGDFALAESMAINLYLTKAHGRRAPLHLYPEDPAGEARAWRWSLWAQGHLEPWVQRDAAILPLRATADWSGVIGSALATLDRALADGPWLVGERFTVADLNVAGVLSPSRAAGLDMAAHGRVRDWLDRCYARPAALATRARHAG